MLQKFQVIKYWFEEDDAINSFYSSVIFRQWMWRTSDFRTAPILPATRDFNKVFQNTISKIA